MTAENPSFIPEHEVFKTSFEKALVELSKIEDPTPLLPEMIDVCELKKTLFDSGLLINLVENNPALSVSIQESQFRNISTGRGPAMVVALGGAGNLERYMGWAAEISANQPTLYSGDESTKTRGLLQFAADTIALATNNLSVENYCRKTNWRVGKKYQKDADLSVKFNLPTDDAGLKKLKETSSIPKGSAIEAFRVILSLNK